MGNKIHFTKTTSTDFLYILHQRRMGIQTRMSFLFENALSLEFLLFEDTL